MAAFWAVSISLYLNRRWTQPIWQACRADDGRDWMLNSGVCASTTAAPGAAHARGRRAALFATYPLWLWLGWQPRRAR